ncbi:hypothetical protein [Kineococcus sp. SYSU DK006]|uniref:hypothetical protein n=1 Tax=Kineococcus sp. SYSU DK006 TaxID=3383127 RepID=UPI003D7DEDE0
MPTSTPAGVRGLAAGTDTGPVLAMVGIHLGPGGAVGALAHPHAPATARRHGGQPVQTLTAVLQQLAPPAGTRVLLDVSELLIDLLGGGYERLAAVTTVRISPSERSIGELYSGWPASVVARVDAGRVHLHGGHDFQGRRLGAMDHDALHRAVALAQAHGSASFAVSAVGSLVDSSWETDVADQLSRLSGRPVAMSHTAGGVRQLERECTAVLDAALAPAVSRMLDELSAAVDAVVPGARPGFTLADGSWVSREQARLHASRLLGSRTALLVQGAAATAGVGTAHVLLRTGGVLQAAAVEQGCVRVDPVRELSPWLPGVRANQRHASALTVADADGEGLPLSALTGQPVVLLEATSVAPAAALAVASPGASPVACPGASAGTSMDALAQKLRGSGLQVHEIIEAEEVLLARGVCAALAQCEVVTYASAEPDGTWDRAREAARRRAQASVLTTDPRAHLRTVTDQVVPLSYLSAPLVQVRSFVAAAQESVRVV